MIVESSTAKKTTSKTCVLPPTPAMTGKVASTTGTAPRSPAAESARRSLHVNRAGRVAMATATGRETKTSTSASTVPRTATSSSRLGKTSRPERDEHRHLPHPGQALVEGGHGLLGGDADRAQRQPGEVDGQEARAVQGVGAAEGQGGHGERRHRVQAGGGEGHAPQRPHRPPRRPRRRRPARCRSGARRARPCSPARSRRAAATR